MPNKLIVDSLQDHDEMSKSNKDMDEIDGYFNDSDSSDSSDSLDSGESGQDLDQDLKKGNYKNNEIIGIDLGTTNSCVSVWRNKNLEIIPDEYGNRTIPSIVSFTAKNRYIGVEAKNQLELNPENTYYEVKRIIGRKIDDDSVKNDLPFLSYSLCTSDENDKDKDNIMLKCSARGRKQLLTPEEISANVLMKLKNMATSYLQREVDQAVITVPAYFNDAQRQATKDAATISGLDCVRIINEPTSAALAYGLEKLSINKDQDINVIVYDLGGGTLDVSLLNIADGVFEVLASTGNTHLGGADFDNRLVSFCMNEFKRRHKINKLENLSSVSLQRLRKSCENAKKLLSITGKATIAVKDFYDEKTLIINITREQFEKICKDLLILCLKPVDDILKSCDLSRDDIDDIILVGGCTRMPAIRNNLSLFFGGKEPNSTINPDEVVAAGAAIQGYILSNKNDPFSENVVLLDIIPLSLGVETIGDVMDVLISRNSVIPIKRKKKFTTDSDYETFVKIKIFEGERKMTRDNFFVGEFELRGIEPAPRGVAEIEITFSIDINGIINVTAEDLKDDKNKNSITITGNKGRLTKDEIKKLVDEAREHELKDRLEREKKQLYYEIEDLCSNIKINMTNDEFKLKDKDREIINLDISKINEWLKEKTYADREKKELLRILDRIKKRYGTLMLKVTNENDNVKDAGNIGNKGVDATTVYGDDDEENMDLVYEELENEEFGLDGDMDDELKQELKELREMLVSLCYSIFDILSDNLLIEEDHKEELKDYIDDILLWVHVKEKITKLDYQEKIEQVNKVCNDIAQKYENKNIFDDNPIAKEIDTKRNELEQLCYAILSSIQSNLFSIHEKQIENLKNKIDETLDWLIEINIRDKEVEYDNNENNKNDNTIIKEKCYQNKIDEINDLCTDLYSNMVSINIEEIREDTQDTQDTSNIMGISGTTIDSLFTD
jgi:molecular chaperone DnaK (HSP70)